MDSHAIKNVTGNFSEDLQNIAVDCHRHLVARIIGSLVTIVIAIISIAGNVAVVIVSFQDKILRAQVGNLLIVYLSSVDILTAIFVMVPSAIAVAFDYWPLGQEMCKFHAFFNYMFACSSSVNLTVISIDRAIAIAYPFHYQANMTFKVITKMCAFVFILSFVVGLACAGPNWISYNYTEAACAMEYTSLLEVYYVFTTCCFTCYYMPVVILSICNSIIIVTARRSGNSKRMLFIRRDNVNNSLKETVENENHMKKTIKSLIVVVLTYYVCFTPYALIKQAKTHLGIDMPSQVNYLSTIFIYIASATNPFIYAILRKDYRNAFKRLLKILSKKVFF